MMRLAVLVTALSLTGCASVLPSSGPTTDDFSSKSGQFSHHIVEVGPQVLQVFAPAPSAHFTNFSAPAVGGGATIAEGDVLAVTIYSIGSNAFENPGSTPAEMTSATTRDTLPNLVVTDGAISVPFAGKIAVAGRTPVQVQDQIAAALKRRSVQPQVLVGIVSRVRNAVLVYGDVKQAGRFPMPLSNQTLLDAIAQAGGPLHGALDTFVSVTRGAQTQSISLSDIYAVNDNNISLAPGDRIEVQYRPRTFSVFGAAPRVLEINFEKPQLNLGEAIARAGGPDQQAADPTSVYLFRFEQPAIGAKLGLSPDTNAVIYHLDLLKPDSYFAVQRFPMQDGDVIYIANARSNLLQKFLALIGQAFGPTSSAVNVVR